MQIVRCIVFLILIGLVACVPSEKKLITEVNERLDDPNLQKIHDFQDRQLRDSIYPFLHHEDPSFRYRAALAFASFRDSKSIDSLASLLNDPVARVRETAAYSLGQIGDTLAEPYLIQAFTNQDTLDVNNKVQQAVLEAIGKCGSLASLKSLSEVSTYKPDDDHLLAGQTKAIYRFALRGMTIPEGTKKMVEYVTNDSIPEHVKLMAANYLFRARDIDISDYKFQVSRVFSQHKDPRIRMALARPLAQTADPAILNILLGQLSAGEDYRVKCNILRELGKFEYIEVVERVIAFLDHTNHHVALTAAQYLVDHGISNDALIYADYARKPIHWRARAKVFQSVLRHIPVYYSNTRGRIRNEVIQLYSSSNNPYEKAALVEALAEDLNAYAWLIENPLKDSSVVVRMAALQQLGTILSHEQFNQVFTGRRRYTRLQNLTAIQEAVASGDAGLIAVASSIIQQEDSGLKRLIADVQFLEEAKKKLSLPQDIEAYQALQSAINYINGEDPPKDLPVNTDHRIDWSIINQLSDSSRAFIFTSKGKITLKLNEHLCPGSVANFIKLAEEDFYDGKVFHRVVPNFVIQGGCPRGDGYGSLDYTIRSELGPMEYDRQGKVGMASAGNHTECTQWFITHSPTPHLNGNYSLFAEVVSGMEVVHTIEMGDVIEDIRILRL